MRSCRDRFQLIDNTDTVTDLELARLLVDFGFDAVELLSEDEDVRLDFATFMRTKSRPDREAWLAQSRRLPELMAEASGRTDASAELDRDPETQGNITEALLSDLSSLAVRTPTNKRQPHARSARWAALAVGSAASAAFAPAVAVPLGVVAGGVYMAGRGTRKVAPLAQEHASSREKRARRSKLVQNVVVLSAFVVAAAPAGTAAQ